MNDILKSQRITYRLSQAQESLKEAEVLFQSDLFRGAVNRAYYAMFYTVLALTVLNEKVISKHSGLIAYFDVEYIKTGALPKELSKMLHLAFDRRQSADYGEVWAVDQVEASEALRNAREFVSKVTELITSG